MRILSFLFLMLLTTSIFGQKSIKQSNKLIAEKKYRSAWELLEKADPKNQDPEITSAKTELLITYFINTVMHKVFTLKDLQKNEKVEDFRNKDENGKLIKFDASEILDSLLKKYPGNYKMNKVLGDYYYEVFIHFQENWVKKPEVLVVLIEDNYSKALKNGQGDYLVSYRIGFAQLFMSKFRLAQKSLSRTVSLNPKYPEAFYSLAYTYLQLDQPDSALINAKKAKELFADTMNRTDAILLTAMIYSTKHDSVNALKEYKSGYDGNPGNQAVLKMLLTAELKYNAPDFHAHASVYFDKAPKEPETYSDLINSFFEANRSKELMDLFSEKLKHYEKAPEICGNIYFYRAYIFTVMEEKAMAKSDLQNAKLSFSKIFPAEHDIFKAINDALKELDK